jgi:hypothetical protein
MIDTARQSHYRVAVFIEDERSSQPGYWAWATARGCICKFFNRQDAEALASFGVPGEARVVEIPVGSDANTLLA